MCLTQISPLFKGVKLMVSVKEKTNTLLLKCVEIWNKKQTTWHIGDVEIRQVVLLTKKKVS